MPVPDHTSEVEQAVGAALARHGVAARVVLRGTTVELRGLEREVAVEIGAWGQQWPLLPPAIRARKVEQAARRLAAAAAGRRSPGRAGRAGPIGGRLRSVVVVAAGVVLVVALVLWLRHRNFFGAAPHRSGAAAGGGAVTESASQPGAADRAAEVCEAARGRLHRGGSLAGFDVEGWEAVFWMAPAPPDRSWRGSVVSRARSGELLEQARRVLGVGPVGSLRVVGEGEGCPVRHAPGSVALRFGGELAAALFRSDERGRMIDLVRGWARREGAQYAALYGSCAHRDVADVGAWFGGGNRSRAIAALLLVAGSCGPSPSVRIGDLAGEGSALERLSALARELDRQRSSDLLARAGGTAAEAPAPDGGGTALTATIRFPLGGPTRAAAASRRLWQSRPSDAKH